MLAVWYVSTACTKVQALWHEATLGQLAIESRTRTKERNMGEGSRWFAGPREEGSVERWVTRPSTKTTAVEDQGDRSSARITTSGVQCGSARTHQKPDCSLERRTARRNEEVATVHAEARKPTEHSGEAAE